MKYFVFYLGLFATLSFCVASCNNKTVSHKNRLQRPEPIGDDEAEMQKRRQQYFDLIHRVAPGADWRKIDADNNELLAKKIEERRMFKSSSPQTMATFANGFISGEWDERGSRNIAGSNRYVDYEPGTNSLYLVSDGGTLWKGDADLGNWVVLNQTKRFNPQILKVIENGSGGKRIIAAANNNIQFSDDDGSSFTPASGINFPVGWGGNQVVDLVYLNDAGKTLYCLTRAWDPAPWLPRFWLYRSTNKGQNFTQVHTFDFGEDNQLSLFSPNGSSELYALDVNSTTSQSTLYSVSGSNVTILSNSTVLPVNVPVILKGCRIGGTVTFYAMTNNNRLYRSDDNGLNWTLQSNLPENSWNRLEVSLSDPGKLFFGGVNAYKSVNSGVNWSLVTGGWEAYYGNPATKLHADIMQVQSFRKSDNTEFMVVTCHGGYYISYDFLNTVSNKSMLNLNTAQAWDVITDRSNNNIIYLGSQDQGIQKGVGAVTTSGPLDFYQWYSGDYGQLVITDNPSRLWIEYPGGSFHFYTNPPVINSFRGGDAAKNVLGSQKPLAGWILATSNTGNAMKNEILIGGGNMSGGSGSYLIKFKSSLNPASIVDSQYSFNFRTNANNGQSGISAVKASSISDKIYVATEDGTFFYSNNKGLSWNKSAAFAGPSGIWLFGSNIAASSKNSNIVWYAGSGYSNPPVYKSVNGGESFSPMSNGLPSTLVYEIATDDDEQLIFAATAAGPYVYIAAKNQWYSLADAGTPIQDYTTVEYIPGQQIARFGTYGRGVWDFKIGSSIASNVVCKGGNGVFASTITGATYQWQVDKGNGFENITSNANYTGANTAVLNLTNIPSSFYGYLYRCQVEGNYSTVNSLRVVSYWNGFTSREWDNISNWGCGSLPDANTEVVVYNGSLFQPEVNSNVSVRKIELHNNAVINVKTGFTLTVTGQ